GWELRRHDGRPASGRRYDHLSGLAHMDLYFCCRSPLLEISWYPSAGYVGGLSRTTHTRVSTLDLDIPQEATAADSRQTSTIKRRENRCDPGVPPGCGPFPEGHSHS